MEDSSASDSLLLPSSPDEASSSLDAEPATGVRAVRLRLYLSHSLSAWNSRMFEFGAVLFLASIFPGTLLYASIYALVRALAVVALSSWLGDRVDRADRLVAVRHSIGWRFPSKEDAVVTLVLFVAVGLLACVEKLAATANTVAVERDWVYRAVPALAKAPPSASNEEEDMTSENESRSLLPHWHAAVAPWREYVTSRVFLASFALSLLYLTVLSFGGTMVTYLLHTGFNSLEVSAMRIGSVAAELSGTWTAPFIMNRIGPIRSGLWFLNWQLCCVAGAAAAYIFDASSQLVACSLIVGVALSRIGLWGFDLSVQFLVQDNVPENARARFSSTEMALQNLFEMLSFASTIVFSRPQQFQYPVLISCGAVAVAAACFAAYVRQERGHLLHRSRCLGGDKWAQPIAQGQSAQSPGNRQVRPAPPNGLSDVQGSQAAHLARRNAVVVSLTTHDSRRTANTLSGARVGGLASAAAAVAAAANASQRSPDLNFFNTVLRSDEHHKTIPAAASPLRRLPPDPESYPPDLGGPFDMLGFMGGITSELEQKHLDLTSGPAAAFTASPTPQSLPASNASNRNGEERSFTADRRTPLSPDAPSSLIDSMGSASDTRGSWSDPGTASYEDQLLQHFLTIDPPASIFGPVEMEWKYVRPAILAHARGFSPLINAVYCYSDIHRAMLEGKQWHWAPTYYRVASSEIQACLLGEVAESTLIKIFAAVFLLMLSELLSSPELCSPDTSYIHSSYLILERFHARTWSWTGLGHLLVSWISLLDVKALIAGRDGDPLVELGNVSEHRVTSNSSEMHSPRAIQAPAPAPVTPEDRSSDSDYEDPFRSPSYLVYEAIVGPAFQFFVQAQQVVRRIVCIDLHHRSRGTLSDEFEVLQIAHKVGADLETLWHRRPPIVDVYGRPEALADTLCAPIATEICRTFRQYVANFLANFIYLHRVAFAIYPRTDRVNGAVDQIIQLATVESAAGPEPGHLPVSFLYPLFVAGLEGSADQRQWIVHEMQRMAAARRETDPAAAINRHPSADKVLLLLEEMTRRQDVSRTWADSRSVRRELFSDFFVMI
ncbi:hypothetical protein N7510_004194 [Penicillium lagena]|uniref:uncharacterized protein n=1 Tax=Penicillium lagena TaxID=94218 RepID=UPI0025400235|nr:uncharacterized protein N7510_004194 [Penicillium lagena]KAJ5620210.1 hypothetical protein N7510_004194 [Penicillium lagena]